jgi:hypothetical protein
MGDSNDQQARGVKRALWPIWVIVVVTTVAAIQVAVCLSGVALCGVAWCIPTVPTAYHRLLLALALIVLVLACSALGRGKAEETTSEGGVKAIELIQEWSKWMAGIQTAAFGAFAWLVFDKDAAAVKPLTDFQRFTATVGFVHLGSALFCTAWLLSALPSQVIRLHAAQTNSTRANVFDVYEQPLFGWWAKLKLGYMMTVMHWLWAIGLISLAAYCLSLLVDEKVPVPGAAQTSHPAIECKVLVNR